MDGGQSMKFALALRSLETEGRRIELGFLAWHLGNGLVGELITGCLTFTSLHWAKDIGEPH